MVVSEVSVAAALVIKRPHRADEPGERGETLRSS